MYTCQEMYLFCSADCSPNDELLKHFTKVSSKLIYAEMFGFRFSDSGYITIRCAVGIFPEKTNKVNCALAVFFSSDENKDDF